MHSTRKTRVALRTCIVRRVQGWLAPSALVLPLPPATSWPPRSTHGTTAGASKAARRPCCVDCECWTQLDKWASQSADHLSFIPCARAACTQLTRPPPEPPRLRVSVTNLDHWLLGSCPDVLGIIAERSLHEFEVAADCRCDCAPPSK